MKRYLVFFTVLTLIIGQFFVTLTMAVEMTHTPTARERILTTVYETKISGNTIEDGDTIDLTRFPEDGDPVTIRLEGGHNDTRHASYTILGNPNKTIKNFAIVVGEYTDLTIHDLNIKSAPSHGSDNASLKAYSTIHFNGGNNKLIIKGTNTVAGCEFYIYYENFGPAVGVGEGVALEISEDITGGTLDAMTSAGGLHGPVPIGSGQTRGHTYRSLPAGKITIKSGTINAEGPYVAIGSNSTSNEEDKSEVNIEGGTINASTYYYPSNRNAINANTINISNGKVTANGIECRQEINITGGRVIAYSNSSYYADIGSDDGSSTVTITGGSVYAEKFDIGQPTNGAANGNSTLRRNEVRGGMTGQTIARTVTAKEGFNDYIYTYDVADGNRAYLWLPEPSIETPSNLPDVICSFKKSTMIEIKISGLVRDITYYPTTDLPEGFALNQSTGVVTIAPATPAGTYIFGIKAVDSLERDITPRPFTVKIIIKDYDVIFDLGGTEKNVTVKGNVYGTIIPIANPTKEHFTFRGWYTADGKEFNPNDPIEEDTVVYAKWDGNLHDIPKGSSAISISSDEPPFKAIIKLINKDAGAIMYIGIEKSGKS